MLSQLNASDAASERSKGWFSREALLLSAWLDKLKKNNDIVSNIFEIGRHCGKSTLLLSEMVDPATRTRGVIVLDARFVPSGRVLPKQPCDFLMNAMTWVWRASRRLIAASGICVFACFSADPQQALMFWRYVINQAIYGPPEIH